MCLIISMPRKEYGELDLKLDISNEKTTLYVVIVTSFLTTFMGSSITLSIPSIGTEFNSSTILLNWIVTGYILASAAFSLPMGRFSDIVGRKRIFIGGIWLFSIFTLLSGLTWSIHVLIFFRIMQGLASAMIFSTNIAILLSAFPPQKRGHALGFSTSATYIGLSTGPVVGGFLNHYLGWRSIFYIVFALGLAVGIFATLYLKEQHEGLKDEKPDLTGNILYILFITSLLYGISAFSSVAWAKYIIIPGLIMFGVFVYHELRTEHPVIQVRLFKDNLAFSLSNLAALINYSATFAIGYLISLYLQIVLKYDSQIAGLILLSQPLIMAILSPFTGRLSDRTEARIVASLGMGITALGLLIFSFISGSYPLWLIIVNLILIGIGLALFSSPNTNAVMGTVEKKYYGVTSSVLATMRLIGQAVSMAAVTLIMSIYIEKSTMANIPPNMLLKSIRATFILFTIASLFGIFASLKRGNMISDS